MADHPPPPSSTQPAAILHLIAEHEAGRQQFAILRGAVRAVQADPAALTTALEELHGVLDYLTGPLELHIAKEEGPLFPRLKAALPDDDRLIDEMVAEHDLIRIKRDLLQSVVLEVLDGDHQDLRAAVQILRDTLAAPDVRAGGNRAWLPALATAVDAVVGKAEVHFENEEELVFPLAPQLLDAATLDRVDIEITALDQAG
jgi:iron-sulfur cluster repair protein YtfE (RIC family)